MTEGKHDNYMLKNELRQAKSITGFHVCKILHSQYCIYHSYK